MSGPSHPPRVPGHRLLRLLGKGAMGEVWLARREEDGREVAVKILARPGDEEDRRRFAREALALLNLSHENIVAGLSLGEAEGRVWLSMEYCPGGSLKDRVARDGPLPEREAVRVALEAARGLGEAARAGVMHRDVKPANLLFDAESRVKVADLGLVSLLARGDEGPRVGTPAYMAPEAIRREAVVDHRADIYSLGLSLYFAVTGEAPFPRRGRRAILRCQLHTPLPDPRTRRPGLSGDLAKLLAKMAAKAPEDRYGSFDELALDLSLLARGESPLGAAISALRRVGARKRSRLPAAALAGLVLAAAALLLLLSPRRSPPPVPDPAEAYAKGQLDLAERLLEEGTGAEALAALRDVARTYPETRAGRRAARLAADLQRKLDEKEEARRAALEKGVRDLLAAGELDRARESLARAAKALPAGEASRIEALGAEIEKAAALRLDRLRKRVRERIAAGDLDAARALVSGEDFPREGGIAGFAAARLAEIDALRRKRRAAARARYGEAVAAALREAGRGLWARARERIRAAPAGLLGDLPARDLEILEAARRFREAVRAGIRKRVGGDAALVAGGEVIVARILGLDGEGRIRLEGRGEPVDPRALDTATAAFLAPGRPPWERAADALLRGEPERARELLGEDDSPLARRLRELLPLVPAGPPASTGIAGRGGTAGPGPAPGSSTGPSPAPPRDPARSKLLTGQGLDAWALGRRVRAVALFRAARDADPENGDARIGLARALLDYVPENPSPALARLIRRELAAARRLRPDLAREADRLEARLPR